MEVIPRDTAQNVYITRKEQASGGSGPLLFNVGNWLLLAIKP